MPRCPRTRRRPAPPPRHRRRPAGSRRDRRRSLPGRLAPGGAGGARARRGRRPSRVGRCSAASWGLVAGAVGPAPAARRAAPRRWAGSVLFLLEFWGGESAKEGSVAQKNPARSRTVVRPTKKSKSPAAHRCSRRATASRSRPRRRRRCQRGCGRDLPRRPSGGGHRTHAGRHRSLRPASRRASGARSWSRRACGFGGWWVFFWEGVGWRDDFFWGGGGSNQIEPPQKIKCHATILNQTRKRTHHRFSMYLARIQSRTRCSWPASGSG